jgi:hypothetical protein
MKQKITTILVIWVFSLIGLMVTAESLDFTFFLFFTAFGFTSYALRYNSNIITNEE